MEEHTGAKDSQLVLRLGILLCVFASLAGFFIHFLGGVFILCVILTTFYLTSFFASRQKPLGNLLRGMVPPRTHWCSKMEFDHLLIPEDVDSALERLYERIIMEHIDSWYRDLSLDEEFLQELRQVFREATTEILIRLTRIDLTETILNDVIPLSLQHLDTYLWALHHSGLQECDNMKAGDTKLYNTWLAFMGKEVHPALASREAETQFIENIADKLLPLIIKARHTKSRLTSSLTTAVLSHTLLQPALDLLCSPRIINKLLRLWFSPAPTIQLPSSQEPPVRLLLRFVHARNQPKPSALHVDLSAILKDTSLLYPFLQYLKRNGGVNLLQFCLAVEDFNKKMMVVDLPDDKLVILHKDAKSLYDSYIKVGADNFIKFDDDIIKEVGNIVNQGHTNIQKLRTTPPLFRAYEQVYNNLEDNFCPQFHTSDEYLGLVLGPRLSEMRGVWNTRLETESKTKKSSAWRAAIKRFKRSPRKQKSVFYIQRQEYQDQESGDYEEDYCQCDLGLGQDVGLVRTASLSNLLSVDDYGTGADMRRLSRSMDCLDTDAEPKLSVSCESVECFPPSTFLVPPPASRSPPRKLSVGKKLVQGLPWTPRSSPSPSHGKVKLAKTKSEVLSSAAMEGSPEPDCDPGYDLATIGAEGDTEAGDGETRDLSAWRVTVPRLEARTVEGKACFTFVIQVQRIDVTSQTDGGEDLEWTVDRQYHEFYSLQSALVQYHGIFQDAKLPPRAKLFGGKGLDVLQSKLEPFEEFLVRLLQKPNLKKSDLLYTFLTSRQEFNQAASQLGLTRIIKTVPNIIKKEKGQFLQTFITTYVASTQCPPPRPGRLDGESEVRETLHPLYGDNFSAQSPFPVSSLGPSQTCTVQGLYDTLFYLALRVARLSDPWLRLLSGLRLVVGESLNHLIHHLLATKLESLLTSGRVTHLIEAVEEAVFDPSPPLEDSKEEERLREATLQAFRSYLPSLLTRFLGKSYNPSTQTIFNCVQEPLLNKQLTYGLLETLLVKIFPELRI